jgi:hypothetical protein
MKIKTKIDKKVRVIKIVWIVGSFLIATIGIIAFIKLNKGNYFPTKGKIGEIFYNYEVAIK